MFISDTHLVNNGGFEILINNPLARLKQEASYWVRGFFIAIRWLEVQMHSPQTHADWIPADPRRIS